MDEARGAGGKSSDLGAVRELTSRELGLHLVGSLGDVGEEELG
jgi:hypothetical protein